MKNIILGSVGAMIILLGILICLSIYGTATRKNEMENGISQSMMAVMQTYYMPELLYRFEEAKNLQPDFPSETAIRDELTLLISQRVSSDSTIYVHVKACDLKKGILSVEVIEEYRMPIGSKRTRKYEKTIIAEG